MRMAARNAVCPLSQCDAQAQAGKNAAPRGIPAPFRRRGDMYFAMTRTRVRREIALPQGSSKIQMG